MGTRSSAIEKPARLQSAACHAVVELACDALSVTTELAQRLDKAVILKLGREVSFPSSIGKLTF
jgi:hypothetical protein